MKLVALIALALIAIGCGSVKPDGESRLYVQELTGTEPIDCMDALPYEQVVHLSLDLSELPEDMREPVFAGFYEWQVATNGRVVVDTLGEHNVSLDFRDIPGDTLGATLDRKVRFFSRSKLQRTAMHEAGHILQIDHVPQVDAVMYPYVNAATTPTAVDLAGLCYLWTQHTDLVLH